MKQHAIAFYASYFHFIRTSYSEDSFIISNQVFFKSWSTTAAVTQLILRTL